MTLFAKYVEFKEASSSYDLSQYQGQFAVMQKVQQGSKSDWITVDVVPEKTKAETIASGIEGRVRVMPINNPDDLIFIKDWAIRKAKSEPAEDNWEQDAEREASARADHAIQKPLGYKGGWQDFLQKKDQPNEDDPWRAKPTSSRFTYTRRGTSSLEHTAIEQDPELERKTKIMRKLALDMLEKSRKIIASADLEQVSKYYDIIHRLNMSLWVGGTDDFWSR